MKCSKQRPRRGERPALEQAPPLSLRARARCFSGPPVLEGEPRPSPALCHVQSHRFLKEGPAPEAQTQFWKMKNGSRARR